MKKIKILVFLLAFIGCKSITPIYKEVKLQKISKLGYIEPIYKLSKKVEKAKSLKNYKKYTNKRVDSLFLVDAKKYRISKKVSSQKIDTTEIHAIFDALRTSQKIIFSSNFKSFLKGSQEEYIMMLHLRPKISYIASEIPIVGALKMEVIIIKTNTEEIIFFDDAYSAIRNNTGKQLFDNINYIYSKLD
ncbi:hypothetical protein [uncultured Kordia sp.]|uniref:hypothetical protein n=1 Tax=uncultured Kordia sp. TaxID=507699 RepID=UPI00260D017F|nr:hypothetical protein [uncultured Kordia sp.]